MMVVVITMMVMVGSLSPFYSYDSAEQPNLDTICIVWQLPGHPRWTTCLFDHVTSWPPSSVQAPLHLGTSTTLDG